MDFAVPIADHGFIQTPLAPPAVNPFALGASESASNLGIYK